MLPSLWEHGASSPITGRAGYAMAGAVLATVPPRLEAMLLLAPVETVLRLTPSTADESGGRPALGDAATTLPVGPPP
jgi:hypothetical protein